MLAPPSPIILSQHDSVIGVRMSEVGGCPETPKLPALTCRPGRKHLEGFGRFQKASVDRKVMATLNVQTSSPTILA